MTLYVVHDVHGRILKHGSAVEQDISLVNIEDGETLVIVERTPSPADESIVDGVLVSVALPPIARSGYELMEFALISLSKSDWTQLPDVTMSDERRAEWRSYRKKLRDIINYRDPATPEGFDDVWPTQPA